MKRAIATLTLWMLAAALSGLAASACSKPRLPPPPPLEGPPPPPPPLPPPPPPPPPPLPPPDAIDIGCDSGEAASPDLFVSMLRQCGDRVNVVALGSSLSPPDVNFSREFGRLMRHQTPTNVLHLDEFKAGAATPEPIRHELAEVLRKSRGKITFVLLSGGGDDLAREDALETILDTRDANSPNTVLVTLGEAAPEESANESADARGVIVVPTDGALTDDGSARRETVRRTLVTVGERCRGLFGSGDGPGGARHCQLQP